jgi:hypothetical protein
MATGKIRADTSITNPHPRGKFCARARARARHPRTGSIVRPRPLSAGTFCPRACPHIRLEPRRREWTNGGVSGDDGVDAGCRGSRGCGQAGGWHQGAASGGATPRSPRAEEAGLWRHGGDDVLASWVGASVLVQAGQRRSRGAGMPAASVGEEVRGCRDLRDASGEVGGAGATRAGEGG